MIFDADSHVMETAEWLPSFADPDVRDKLSGWASKAPAPARRR